MTASDSHFVALLREAYEARIAELEGEIEGLRCRLGDALETAGVVDYLRAQNAELRAKLARPDRSIVKVGEITSLELTTWGQLEAENQRLREELEVLRLSRRSTDPEC